MSTKPWVGKSVLIIDDAASVRDELKRVFTAVGVKVVGTAENGVIGLEKLKSLQPDLVSIDIIMPEMDGIECYRKIMAMRPETVCLMISWLASDEAMIGSLKELVPSHLFQAKPVTSYDLEARLKKIYFPDLEKSGGIKASAQDLVVDDEVFGDLGVKVS